jgi:hypothetical protein
MLGHDRMMLGVGRLWLGHNRMIRLLAVFARKLDVYGKGGCSCSSREEA